MKPEKNNLEFINKNIKIILKERLDYQDIPDSYVSIVQLVTELNITNNMNMLSK